MLLLIYLLIFFVQNIKYTIFFKALSCVVLHGRQHTVSSLSNTPVLEPTSLQVKF